MRRGVPLFDDRFSLESPTGALLTVYRKHAQGRPRGILLVSHGLAEHAGRYGRFAADMARLGLAVYAHDHRGHGSTSAPDAPLRRFAKRSGSKKLAADCVAVHLKALEDHPGLPVLAFGHSMGGLVALGYAMRPGSPLAGLAVWNSRIEPFDIQGRLAILALKAEKMLKGSDTASRIFAGATLDAWSRSISPRRTNADWLSHDAAAVDAFLSDPLCGWTPTVSMAEDLVVLARSSSDEMALALLPRDLPVHLLGGTEDPATDGGATVRDFAGRLRLVGSRDVTLTIVEGARHETLNEVEPMRAKAIAALTAWIDRVLPVH